VDPVLNNTGDTDVTNVLQYKTGQKAVVYNNNITINSSAGQINIL
jgi:hypothetical protein